MFGRTSGLSTSNFESPQPSRSVAALAAATRTRAVRRSCDASNQTQIMRWIIGTLGWYKARWAGGASYVSASASNTCSTWQMTGPSGWLIGLDESCDSSSIRRTTFRSGTADCNKNAKFPDFLYCKCRDNGESPLKNDEFALKNGQLFCNLRYRPWSHSIEVNQSQYPDIPSYTWRDADVTNIVVHAMGATLCPFRAHFTPTSCPFLAHFVHTLRSFILNIFGGFCCSGRRVGCENYEFCIKNENFCIRITQKREIVYQKRGILYFK